MASSEPRIVFENVTKSFRDRTRPRVLRDAIPSALGLLLGRKEPEGTRFVALDDVSFSVAPGEALGLIGRNGAGKSTTLKLAAGVFRPDSGRARVVGRFASMIELSAGFHPDLSGRENVYLNAALLGLRRNQIEDLLPRIIEFSGVERFIDAPYRVYSTGMGVRLGFAVAAHVPADVLLVDEVLAVGDADFYVKCLDRMAERRSEGVSVLFVSHNLAVMEQFCDRVAIIDAGRKVEEGEPVDIIDEYRRMVLAETDGPQQSRDAWIRRGCGTVTISDVTAFGDPAEGASLAETERPIVSGRPFTVRLRLECEPGTPAPTLGVEIHAPAGTMIASCQSHAQKLDLPPLPGPCDVDLRFDSNALLPGAYAMTVYARDPSGIRDLDVHSKAHRLAVHGDRPAGDLGMVDLRPRWIR